MMRDDELRSFRERLVHDRHHRVDCEQHAGHRGVRITAREADRIPLRGEPGRIRLIKGSYDIADADLTHDDAHPWE